MKFYRLIIPLSLMLACVSPSLRAHCFDALLDSTTNFDCIAVTSGNWTAPGTWSNGVPGLNQNVLIPTNVTVTLDVPYTNNAISNIVVFGSLKFINNGQLRLSTMIVPEEGIFQIGSVDSPITADHLAQITIVNDGPINTNWDPGAFSHGILADGRVIMCGAEKTGFVMLSSNVMAGATNVYLATAPSGWLPGDEVVFPATTFFTNWLDPVAAAIGYHNTPLQNEVRVIQSLNGTVLTLSSPLTYDHTAAGTPGRVHVANLTRNVGVVSEATDVASRGHVMLCTNFCDVRNAMFVRQGRSDKKYYETDPGITNKLGLSPLYNVRGRYGLHFHECGTDTNQVAGVVTGCVVRDTPGWAYVNHSSYVFMTNNVAYDFDGAGFVTQDGDEAGAFVNNISIGGNGCGRFVQLRTVFGDLPRMEQGDMGFHGEGFWFQGPDITVVSNVAAGCAGDGFMYWPAGRFDPSTNHFTGFPRNRVPAGVTPRVWSFDTNQVLIADIPLRKFANNMAYACYTGLKFRFSNNGNLNIVDGCGITNLSKEVLGTATRGVRAAITDTVLWNNLNGLHSTYQGLADYKNLTIVCANTNGGLGAIAIANETQDGGDTFTNVYITNYITGFFSSTTIYSKGNVNFGGIVLEQFRTNTGNPLGFTAKLLKGTDLPSTPPWPATVTISNVVTTPTNIIVTAIAGGPINSSNTWGGLLPSPGDTNIWQTGNFTLTLTTGVGVDTFNGGTFVIQSGGQFTPNVPTATLTLNNLVLNGGQIYMGNNLGINLNLNGQTFTLNSGTLKAGGANNSRDVRFQNGSLNGRGTIDITGTDTTGSDVEFQPTINTTGFTGVFSVHDNGILNLPTIAATNASFGINLSGTGKYANDADVAVTSLVINGTNFPPGIYSYTSLSNYTTFLVTNLGSLTIVSSSNTSPTLAAITNYTLIAGQILSVTNVVTDNDVPAQTVAFSLLNAPDGAVINATNGVLTWRPMIAQAPSTNTVGVVVSDSGTPSLSATQNFVVAVMPPMMPMINSVNMSNSQCCLTVSGDSGPDYTVLTSTNLIDWLPVWTNLAAVLPFTYTCPDATNLDRCFYRVLIGP